MPLFSLRHLRRPFSNAHWSLFLVVVAGWVLVVLSQPCNEPPYYIEVIFATLTIGITAWAAHLRHRPIDGWCGVGRVVGGAIYDIALLVLAFVLVAFPVAILIPSYQCHTPRAKVSELLLAASGSRNEINKRFSDRKTLLNIGSGLVLKTEGRVKGGTVTSDGTIVIVSEDPPAVVLLVPSVSGNVLEWKCVGFPTHVMPGSCRE